MSGLREALFETLDRLRSKKITPQEAQAEINVAGMLLKSVETQVRYEKAKNAEQAPSVLGEMPMVKKIAAVQ